MKKNNATQLIRHLTLMALAAVLAGCASHGNYEQGSETGAGLQDAANRIATGNDKIDATLGVLNDLVNNPQGDLSPKFKNFNDRVDDLKATAADVRKQVTDTRVTGNEYFKNWDQQIANIKNQDIKNASAQREAAMEKQYMDIKRGYAEVQMSFGPFMSDLKDIQTALGTDLTVGGVGAVKGAADKANTDASALKDSLTKLSGQFRDLGTAMSSSGPTPQTATGQNQ